MQVVRYNAERRPDWDRFVKESKNGTFLFLRDYMDYHADRFTDHSLMYYSDSGKLIALMPGNEREGVLYSHQGLTYGGFILSPKMHIAELGELFDLTLKHLRENGFGEWRYKLVPSIYHRLPSQEDQYWLWRSGAKMVDCNVMTAIDLRVGENACSELAHGTVSSRKRGYANKLRREGHSVATTSIEQFWPVLECNLQERFGSRPVHTLDEIMMLQQRFPNNIVCRTVIAESLGSDPLIQRVKITEDQLNHGVRPLDSQVLAGVVLFITDQVVRTQYISASPEGKRTHALDLLLLSLVEEYRERGFHYFDFGTSMAEDGVLLNEGLILQKELLGGRSIVCPTYAISIR